MSYTEELRRWKQARDMARQLGMPIPAKPQRPQLAQAMRGGPQQMPEVPASARGATQRARSRPGKAHSAQEAAAKLFTPVDQGGYLLTGNAVNAPVSYSLAPSSLRAHVDKQVKFQQAPVGWDPRNMDPTARALLQRMVSLGRAEMPQTEISPEERARLERQSLAQQRVYGG